MCSDGLVPLHVRAGAAHPEAAAASRPSARRAARARDIARRRARRRCRSRAALAVSPARGGARRARATVRLADGGPGPHPTSSRGGGGAWRGRSGAPATARAGSRELRAGLEPRRCARRSRAARAVRSSTPRRRACAPSRVQGGGAPPAEGSRPTHLHLVASRRRRGAGAAVLAARPLTLRWRSLARRAGGRRGTDVARGCRRAGAAAVLRGWRGVPAPRLVNGNETVPPPRGRSSATRGCTRSAWECGDRWLLMSSSSSGASPSTPCAPEDARARRADSTRPRARCVRVEIDGAIWRRRRDGRARCRSFFPRAPWSSRRYTRGGQATVRLAGQAAGARGAGAGGLPEARTPSVPPGRGWHRRSAGAAAHPLDRGERGGGGEERSSTRS